MKISLFFDNALERDFLSNDMECTELVAKHLQVGKQILTEKKEMCVGNVPVNFPNGRTSEVRDAVL